MATERSMRDLLFHRIINYVYADNTRAADTHTETLEEGTDYFVTSPAIDGFTPDRAVVSGTMGSADTIITVTYTANTEPEGHYIMVSGDGQEWRINSTDDLNFEIKRTVNDELTYDSFRGAALNGQTLAAEDYDTARGSLIFTLKAAKAKTLPLGTHTLTFTFTDGTATAAFTVRPVAGSFEDVAVPSDTFTFRKEWQGSSEKSIDFTLYKIDGSVYHHGFDKEVVTKTEWRYNAWFSSPAACYVIEEPIPGYITRYVNVGVYAQITDRCCDGGTIINKKIPKTGDEALLLLWACCAVIGVAGIATALLIGSKRRKRSK